MRGGVPLQQRLQPAHRLRRRDLLGPLPGILRVRDQRSLPGEEGGGGRGKEEGGGGDGDEERRRRRGRG